MKSIAGAVEVELTHTFQEAVKIVNNIYINCSVNEFLDQEYATDLDFYTASTEICISFLSALSTNKSICVIMYVKQKSIRALMESVDLGEGSIIGQDFFPDAAKSIMLQSVHWYRSEL